MSELACSKLHTVLKIINILGVQVRKKKRNAGMDTSRPGGDVAKVAEWR